MSYNRRWWLLCCVVMMCVASNVQAQSTHSLDYYTTNATSKTPLLVDYQNQIQLNLVDSARLRAGFGPQINGTGNIYYAPTLNGLGYDPVITNNGNISALVGVTQQWISKANSSNQYQLLRLRNELLKDSLSLTMQSLKRYVTTLYITAYGDWLQITYYDTTLNLLNQEQNILRSMTESGTYKQTDYLNFNITLQQQSLQRSQLMQRYRSDLALLNYTCGLNDTSFVRLEPPTLSTDSAFSYSSSTLYHKYLTDSLRLILEDNQIDFTYKPKLNIFADAGYNSTLQLNPQKNFGVSGGLNLFIPIYNGGLRKLDHQKIKLSENTRKAYRDFFISQYELQRSQLQQQLVSNNDLMKQTQQQLTYTQTLIQANYKLLTTGDVSITDYLLSMSNYINAKNLMAQNTVNRFHLINEINYWNQLHR